MVMKQRQQQVVPGRSQHPQVPAVMLLEQLDWQLLLHCLVLALLGLLQVQPQTHWLLLGVLPLPLQGCRFSPDAQGVGVALQVVESWLQREQQLLKHPCPCCWADGWATPTGRMLHCCLHFLSRCLMLLAVSGRSCAAGLMVALQVLHRHCCPCYLHPVAADALSQVLPLLCCLTSLPAYPLPGVPLPQRLMQGQLPQLQEKWVQSCWASALARQQQVCPGEVQQGAEQAA